jgi:hypothetical protein
MANILIRDLSQEAVDRIDAAAANLGLSRNEYLRRKLEEGITRLRTVRVARGFPFTAEAGTSAIEVPTLRSVGQAVNCRRMSAESCRLVISTKRPSRTR